MGRRWNGWRAGLLAGAVLSGVAAIPVAEAQDAPRPHRHRPVALHRVAASPAQSRPLTINPPAPSQPGIYRQPYVGDDPSFVGQDDGDAYGNVARFNPEPAITSGVQYPFGLDGVGGFGSDLGFEAGASGSVYQR